MQTWLSKERHDTCGNIDEAIHGRLSRAVIGPAQVLTSRLSRGADVVLKS